MTFSTRNEVRAITVDGISTGSITAGLDIQTGSHGYNPGCWRSRRITVLGRPDKRLSHGGPHEHWRARLDGPRARRWAPVRCEFLFIAESSGSRQLVRIPDRTTMCRPRAISSPALQPLRNWHAGIAVSVTSGSPLGLPLLSISRWKSCCRGLCQLPIAARKETRTSRVIAAGAVTTRSSGQIPEA